MGVLLVGEWGYEDDSGLGLSCSVYIFRVIVWMKNIDVMRNVSESGRWEKVMFCLVGNVWYSGCDEG